MIQSDRKADLFSSAKRRVVPITATTSLSVIIAGAAVLYFLLHYGVSGVICLLISGLLYFGNSRRKNIARRRDKHFDGCNNDGTRAEKSGAFNLASSYVNLNS